MFTAIEKLLIVWLNYNGRILQLDKVEYGVKPEYTGNTPTRTSDPLYSYEFTGWAPEIKTATEDAYYLAEYVSTSIKYTITWLYDGGSI